MMLLPPSWLSDEEGSEGLPPEKSLHDTSSSSSEDLMATEDEESMLMKMIRGKIQRKSGKVKERSTMGLEHGLLRSHSEKLRTLTWLQHSWPRNTSMHAIRRSLCDSTAF